MLLPTSVTFSTVPESIDIPPIMPPIMPPLEGYDALDATTAEPLYRCVGPHATLGGAVQNTHDEHTSDTGVPTYAGTADKEGIPIPPNAGGPADDDVTFRSTCAPLLSAGKPVRLSTPPVRKPHRSPVAFENKAPLFNEVRVMLIKP